MTDLSGRQIAVLGALYETGPIQPCMLARYVRVNSNQLYTTLSSLEKRCLISDSFHRHGGRRVFLNDFGRGVLASLNQEWKADQMEGLGLA